jgi:serine/threonine protein phosphatase PrpC
MRKLTAHARTDVGRVRAHNEDWFAFVEELGVYIVCDGMGGHASGEVASRLTTEHLVDFVSKQADPATAYFPYPVAQGLTRNEAFLSNAIQHANDRVYIEGMKDPKLEGMGTTVVAILATPEVFAVGHVGDSRVYCFHPEEGLHQVTRDHSLLNHKIDIGEITTSEQIANFQQGNIIVRAVGLKDYVQPEVQTVRRRRGDLYLLCSDGLTDLVKDHEIGTVLEEGYDDMEKASETLIDMANARGGKDNITVLMVRIDDDEVGADDTDPAMAMIFDDADTDPAMQVVTTDSDEPEDEDESEEADYQDFMDGDDEAPTRPAMRVMPNLDDEDEDSHSGPVEVTGGTVSVSDPHNKRKTSPQGPEKVIETILVEDQIPSVIIEDSIEE